MTTEAVKKDPSTYENTGECFEDKANPGARGENGETPAEGFETHLRTRKKILICDTQPVAVEGMKWLFENSGDLRFAGAVSTLDSVHELLHPGTALVVGHLTALDASSSRVEGPSAELSDAEGTVSRPAAGDLPSDEHFVTIGDATGVSVDLVAHDASIDLCVDLTIDRSMDLSDATTRNPSPMTSPEPVDAVVIDKALGMTEVMEFLRKIASSPRPVPTVVWGAISEAEALRLLQSGARGILRRTSESGTLLKCLRAVTSGGTWMEDGIFGSTDKIFNPRRSQLTQRESEVVVLVEKGLRNRDIARLLGIQTGTVKIHLKHIFEKTGVRGRYGLALTGLRDKGALAPNSQFDV